jgi:hypothetical protein
MKRREFLKQKGVAATPLFRYRARGSQDGFRGFPAPVPGSIQLCRLRGWNRELDAALRPRRRFSSRRRGLFELKCSPV